MKPKTMKEKSKSKSNSRIMAVYILLLTALLATFVVSVCFGNVKIPADRLARLLFFREGEETELAILWKIRLPRVLLAMILGGALALSGYLLQTFFENPIVGPFVLGISSGAKLSVAAVMILFLDRIGRMSSFAMVIAAFAGAFAVTGFILLAARKLTSPSSLLVAGIMIGYICSAMTELLISSAEDAHIVGLHGWSQGSFSGAGWDYVKVSAIVVGISFLLVFFLSKPIGAYLMGEAYAASVGVSVRAFRVMLILLSSLLAACVTAFAGPISFIGIAVPFLVKRALSTARPIAVIPACFLMGALMVSLCDFCARQLLAPTELKIGVVTSFVGAPIVIYMLLKKTKERGIS